MYIRISRICNRCNHERPGTVLLCGENCPEDRWIEFILPSGRMCIRCRPLPISLISAADIIPGIENILISRNPPQTQHPIGNTANNSVSTERNRVSHKHIKRSEGEIRHETAFLIRSSAMTYFARL